jgi:predicted anti-sigma-YlaC factor YlaD
MTRMLETILERLTEIAAQMTAIANRSERYARWHCWLLAIVLFASVGMFVVGAWTHATQNEVLRQVMQENRAIFQRFNR